MHKSLKYCVYEKKKIRRLDHAIYLVDELFQIIHSKYLQKLNKPTANKKTAVIFKRHKQCLSDFNDFKIERQPDFASFIVTNLKTNMQYNVTLSEWGRHECYLVCIYCGFCTHTFHCSCNEHQFKGSLCIHLHLFSTVKNQLPAFEKPINKRLELFYRFSTDTTNVIDLAKTVGMENENLSVEHVSVPSCQENDLEFGNSWESSEDFDVFDNDNQEKTESLDKYRSSFQDVSRLLSHLTSQMKALDLNQSKESFQPKLDQLYGSLLKCIPILPSPDN